MTDAALNQRSSPRMGGAVLRYHTYPTIQRQTVADHTLHVIRIYWHLFGSVPSAVCAYLVFHDLAEVQTGDLPHPLKQDNADLKVVMDRLEEETLVRMVGSARAHEIVTSVTPTERRRMKACDLLEMAEFAETERLLGSTWADAISRNVSAALLLLELSEDDWTAVREYTETEIGRFR